ncbi:MAG: phosphoribosylanthranilate isomerase [Candidatus Marinamargulisbacteria bacterium]|jgi:phosphoribosylanthranilate isomerase
MMKIKLCGMTNRDDALNAIALGVDAIGFIFYPHSPRFIPPEKVETFMLDIPPFIHTIGVFVNESVDAINDISARCKLSGIQLHGHEAPEFCTAFSLPTIKSIAIKDEDDIKKIPQYKGCVSGVLLDTKVENVYGGTGKTFDWGLALAAKEYDVPLILSGGITPQNSEKAIKMVSPYGVDICSGVEKEPGKKDYHKMQMLIDGIHAI